MYTTIKSYLVVLNYFTFISAGRKYIFDDIQKDQANNNIQSGQQLNYFISLGYFNVCYKVT
jgi:hypothetical protein